MKRLLQRFLVLLLGVLSICVMVWMGIAFLGSNGHRLRAQAEVEVARIIFEGLRSRYSVVGDQYIFVSLAWEENSEGNYPARWGDPPAAFLNSLPPNPATTKPASAIPWKSANEAPRNPKTGLPDPIFTIWFRDWVKPNEVVVRGSVNRYPEYKYFEVVLRKAGRKWIIDRRIGQLR